MNPLTLRLRSPSWLAWALCSLLLVGVAFGYMPRGRAVITWDVAGYYLYLPAVFIHHDLQELRFQEQLMREYAPTPEFSQQAFRHPESGHYVLKYPAGMAVQYLPFFLLAHALAGWLGYPQDGYSAPYQALLLAASVLVAALGLALVRRALRPRFGEWPTVLALLGVVLATNYLAYSAISGAMTHNWLFTWYAALLLLVPGFYQRPTLGRAVAIGAVLGLMTLTRPTDVLAVVLALGWGLRPERAVLADRLAWWRARPELLAAAVVAGAAVLSIQPLYWHYVSGHWVVYSYQSQGFSWLRPHLWNGIFSYQSGWLLYSPLLVVALAGFGVLRRAVPAAFWPMLVFMVLFVYVAFAWDEWLYGGGLGSRAMVQTYAVLAWPWAAACQWVLASRARRWAYAALAVPLTYYSLWLTHGVGRSGLWPVGQITEAYFWRVVGRYHIPPDTPLLLDSNYSFEGTPQHYRLLWQQDFEALPAADCGQPALAGHCSLALGRSHPAAPSYEVPARPGEFEWLQVSALAGVSQPEWDIYKMSTVVVRFCRSGEVVRERSVRLARVLEPGWPRRATFYFKAPHADFDRLTVSFRQAGPATLTVDDLQLAGFDE